MKKILFLLIFIFNNIIAQNQKLTSIEIYEKKVKVLRSNLCNELGIKDLNQVKQLELKGFDFLNINKLIANEKKMAIIEKYKLKIKKLQKEYIDVINIRKIIIPKLSDYIKKSEFETSDKYNKRIDKFNIIADSIIISSITNYIDMKSNIILKLNKYNADIGVYDVEISTDYDELNYKNSFVFKNNDEVPIWNANLIINPNDAKNLVQYKKNFNFISTEYYNWRDCNGILIPEKTCFIVGDNDFEGSYNYDEFEINKLKYELNSIATNCSDITFQFEYDKKEYLFNYTQYMKNFYIQEIEKKRLIEIENQLKFEEQKKRDEEEAVKKEIEKKKKEEEKKELELEEFKKQEKIKFYSTPLGKRAMQLKKEIVNFLSDKKFSLEEITNRFNILKDSILNEEIEINSDTRILNNIKKNYFCKLSNYNPTTEELKLEYYNNDLYDSSIEKSNNYITIKWKKENFEEIQKLIKNENKSPFLLVPITAKLSQEKYQINQFLLLLQPFKKSNITDIYNQSYTKQFNIELKKEANKYLLNCVNRNILEYFSINDIEEPVVLYDYIDESKNFTRIPKKATYLLQSNDLKNQKFDNITLEFLEVDINKSLKN